MEVKTKLQQLLDLYDYTLPPNLIAQKPANPRDSSRLLVVDRQTNTIDHRIFYELPELVEPGSLLVVNDTKVYPARIHGKKITGGRVEVLLVKKLAGNRWEAFSRPGVTQGKEIVFDGFNLRVIQRNEKLIIVEPDISEKDFIGQIEKIGSVPIPPYIKPSIPDVELKKSYQTVYAKESGSAAAPTAGLHFTTRVFEGLKNKDIDIATLTLHVGLGTFAPLEDRNITEGKLHKEYIEITSVEADKINKAKAEGRKIIAVGTTSARTLESVADEGGNLKPFSGETALFIFPGYKFKIVDSLITNFHLPKSSLLMLVSAFCSDPNATDKFVSFSNSLIGKAYEEAIENKYRFFSFGDASFIR